jgi:Tol biopolymer transport system component
MRNFLLIFVAVFSVQSAGCPASDTIEHKNVSFDVAPNGETLVFADADGDLWLYTLGSPKVTRLTESKELESWPSFSANGKSVVFVRKNAEGHGVSVYDITVDGWEIRQITRSDQCSDSQPVFSPDGKTIAFSRSHLRRSYSMGGWTWDNWDVYTVDVDGSNLQRRTNGNYYGIGGVAFSADSRQVYFTTDESRHSDSKQTLFTIDLEGSSVAATKPAKPGKYYA